MSTNLSIRFGLVVLPVALDAGARADRISLRQMAPDGGVIEQRLVSKKTGKEVPRSELRRAAEVGKDVLVEIPADELAALEPAPNKAIDILEFVPADSIDALYFQDSHYMKPQPGGETAFMLLLTVLKSKARIAIAKAWMNSAEHIVAIRPAAGGLVLHKLFFRNEVRQERCYRPDAPVDPAHLKAAEMLVDAMASTGFDPSRFRDEYSEKLRALIAKKVAAVDPAAAIASPAAAPDLIEVMRASIAAIKAGVQAAEPAKPGRHGRAVKRRTASSASSAEVLAQPVVSLLDQIVEAHQERAA